MLLYQSFIFMQILFLYGWDMVRCENHHFLHSSDILKEKIIMYVKQKKNNNNLMNVISSSPHTLKEKVIMYVKIIRNIFNLMNISCNWIKEILGKGSKVLVMLI